MQIYHLQVCYSIWVDFWICSPCWDTFSWFCYHIWSCYYWASFVYFVVMDVITSLGDSRGTLWLPFSLEPVKFVSVLWRVSWYALSRWSCIWKHLYVYTNPLLSNFFYYIFCCITTVLIFMITITVCFTPSLATTLRLSYIWIGEWFATSVIFIF